MGEVIVIDFAKGLVAVPKSKKTGRRIPMLELILRRACAAIDEGFPDYVGGTSRGSYTRLRRVWEKHRHSKGLY